MSDQVDDMCFYSNETNSNETEDNKVQNNSDDENIRCLDATSDNSYTPKYGLVRHISNVIITYIQ